MSGTLLLISDRAEDLAFAKIVSSNNRLQLRQAGGPEDIRKFLEGNRDAIVFWDAESTVAYGGISDTLSRWTTAHKIFALTDDSLDQYPHLFQKIVFGHHIYRRFEGAAPEIISALVRATLHENPFGLSNFFSKPPEEKKIPLKRASHKRAAIEALQNHLSKQGITSRLAALVARSTDELLINAIFDAPIDFSGKKLRRDYPRDMDFPFKDDELIEITLASNADYMGISVRDPYGSLKPEEAMRALRFRFEESAASKGLGFHGIVQTGVSLLLASKNRIETEAMLFFPKAGNFKEFRGGFRFFSMHA